MSTNLDQWWRAEKGSVSNTLLQHVAGLELAQFDVFNRFVQLDALYDPNNQWVGTASDEAPRSLVSENVIASNVDTVAAAIASTEVDAHFQTTGAGWELQRIAKDLEYYAEDLCKIHDVDDKCKTAFTQGSAVKGTGLIYADATAEGKIECEFVRPDDVVVDERECIGGGKIKQLHWRRFRDRDELAAEFPKFEAQIMAAQTSTSTGTIRNWDMWAEYRPCPPNRIVTITSWRMAIGKPDEKGYQPGRKVTAIDGCDLNDEEWTECEAPFAKIVWTKRADGWYGIGLAERIAGHQRMVNRSNLQIERMLDQNAFITTFVDIADANMATKTVNKVGAIVPVKGSRPTFAAPPAVHPELYARHERTIDKSFAESGVSRMASQSMKPAGLDSGRALRTYHDMTTQRFAMQEAAYERFKLDVVLLLLRACSKIAKMGKKPPIVTLENRFGTRKIPWARVEAAWLKSSIVAASNLNNTEAGREQSLIEWAQAGVISTDDFRRLIGHPDLERAMSLYTAAMEDADECIEEISRGHVVMPEPFMNLEMCIWRGQQQLLLWRKFAPEKVLELLRQFVVQAIALANMKEDSVANQNASADPALAAQAGAPAAGTPAAALAPQAMQTMAS